MASIISKSAEETRAAGCHFAESLQPGDIVALVGDLGTGKTHFVKGIAAGLEITASVTSPTFTLIHEYTGGRCPLYHADFYRLKTPAEAIGIGLDEYLNASGILAIEWADKFRDLLPGKAHWIQFQVLDEQRREIILR